jgi:RHS repeat-associated protein
MAKTNPFRFSTKYQDDETDLLYYGYRYYNASTGRWLSRDPLDEDGSENLYGFAGNDSVDQSDYLGLYTTAWGGTTIGQKNSGGRIGGRTLGKTEAKLSINNLKTSVKNCKCCLDSLDLKLELKVYVLAIGDKFKFGWPGGWEVVVDNDIQQHTFAHEQVHVNSTWNIIGTLFPKIETDCTGKCFSKPWFSSWTASSCKKKWESVIQGEMKWAGDKNQSMQQRWDSIDTSFRGPVTQEETQPFYDEVKSNLNKWKQHKFCAPGFLSGDPS